jgi:hypothetical protein
MTPDQQIDALRGVFPDVERLEINGLVCALFPALKISTGKGVFTRRAILYPYADSGYPTRLYIDEKVDMTDNNVNWAERHIGGMRWCARSWNHVAGDKPWIQILSGLMRAFV